MKLRVCVKSVLSRVCGCVCVYRARGSVRVSGPVVPFGRAQAPREFWGRWVHGLCRVGCCGRAHRNPYLIHTYRLCCLCKTQYPDPTDVIAEGQTTRPPIWQTPNKPNTGFIWIRSASIGHHLDNNPKDALNFVYAPFENHNFLKFKIDGAVRSGQNT